MNFAVDQATGLLMDTLYVPSPNQDERPAGHEIELIVIHGISMPPGEYGGPYIEQLFTNRLDPAAHPFFASIVGLNVSAHLLVRRDGQVIQFVPFQRRAWHAGESHFEDRIRCNDFSIGIELEGTDTDPYTPAQYSQLADLIECLMRNYPAISRQRITGHSDIAPQRKTDPGPAFEWAKLHHELDNRLG
jgi:AmpD protein